jgi:hypothetical protein
MRPIRPVLGRFLEFSAPSWWSFGVFCAYILGVVCLALIEAVL